jgi:hypothetical protein
MKRTGILGLLLLFVVFAVDAKGPVNKATGSFIHGNYAVDFTAHEGVVMKNGKIRPAKGMLTSYHMSNPNMYYGVDVTCVNVLSETDAVFVGPVVMAGSDWEHMIGVYRMTWVRDGGEPGAYVDEMHWRTTWDENEAAAFCADPDETITVFGSGSGKHWTFDIGNIQIHYRDPD